jgi:ParB-like chromosome segregation protein Spo0J
MIDRAQVEVRLKKKQAEIASYEEKIRTAKAYVAALLDILKIDGGEAQNAPEAKLRPGSAVAQARDIILARGSAVHIDDLLRAMGKQVTRDSKASLAGSLAAYVRKEDIFSRPAPNTYGLIELGHTTVEEEEEPEIPTSFGETETPSFDTDLDDDVPF